jgi:hypothetical protein
MIRAWQFPRGRHRDCFDSARRVGSRNGVISQRNSIKSGPSTSFARAAVKQGWTGLGSSSGSCQEELLLVISHDDETYDAAAVLSPSHYHKASVPSLPILV